MLASIAGLSEVVQLLLTAGANVELKDRLGLTAIDWSKRRGFSEITDLLATFEFSSGQSVKTPSGHELGKQSSEKPDPPTVSSSVSARTLDGQPLAEQSTERADPLIVSSTVSAPLIQQDKTAEIERTRLQERASIEALFEKLRESSPATKIQEPPAPSVSDDTTAPEQEKLLRKKRLKSEDERITRVHQSKEEDVQVTQPMRPDTNVLSGMNDQLLGSSQPHPLTRPAVWMLLTFALMGGVLIGYQLNEYTSQTERNSTPLESAPVQQQASARPEVTPSAATAPAGPVVVGGALNGAEASLPEPEYPARAIKDGVSGEITVRVRVNKRGRVILARTSGGDSRLRAAAVQAARKATFLPEKLATNERFTSGTITYYFKPSR
jgi:TonB family protein